MNDWAQKMADRIRKQQSEKSTDNAAFLEQQRMKKEFSPLLWQQVVSEAKNNCTRLNAELGQQVVAIEATPSSVLSIRARTPQGNRTLKAEFDAETYILSWATGDSTAKYEVSVGSDRKAQFYPISSDEPTIAWVPVSAKYIADEMMTALFA